MSHPKELNYFMDEVCVDGTVAISTSEELRDIESTPRNWSRGLDWYSGHFSSKAPVRGESSARYTAPWFPGVPERIASVAPEAKLILMVRDPVERALSHHSFLRAEGRESRNAPEALTPPDNIYVVRSRYFEALARFREHFQSSSILVASQEDLRAAPERTMRTIYEFLGVYQGFSTQKLTRQRHRTVGKGRRYRAAQQLLSLPVARLAYRLPEEVKWGLERLVSRPAAGAETPVPPDDPLRARLADQLRPDAERFREATGRAFAQWSV